MYSQILMNQPVRECDEVARFGAERSYFLRAAPHRPVTAHNGFYAEALYETDGLKVGLDVEVCGAQRPAARQRLVACSLNGIAVIKCAILPVEDAKMPVAVARQVQDLENAVLPEAD